MAAQPSGEVNFLQDLPVQNLQQVNDGRGLLVKQAPQNRGIFFGMNQGVADIEADGDGANPLADVYLRKAMTTAINCDATRQVVPAGLIAPPFVNGWAKELDS